MTRYTDLGRKRTYIEAGFPADKQIPDDIENEPTVIDQVEHPQPPKKRKRTKHKRPKGEEGTLIEIQTEGKGESAEVGRTGAENQEVKNAYMNRDENRKKEAAHSTQSEKRRQIRIQEKLANTTCFACREKGHAARECPNVKTGGALDKGKAKSNAVICYRCGSSKHTLSRCKKPENPDNPLPYASCFVCSGKGHIASSCPQNQNKGVYPNGGCCKICGETSHLARNCPTRKQDNGSSSLFVGTGQSAGADEDDFHSFKRVNAEVDLEERKEAKAKRMVDVKMGVMSKTVKSFATVPPAATKKKVVVF